MLLFTAILLAAHHVYCQDTGLVRLVNGFTQHEGRVEVFVEGEWGTVCDDDFGIEEANVICRMLGYSGALASYGSAYYGEGSGKIWLDQLGCTGDEDDVFNCKKNYIGVHNCNHREDAGVECISYPSLDPKQPFPTMSLPVRLSCPYNKSCNNIARKSGPDPGECTPSVHVEGIVEVYYNETWWFVSADDWDNNDVNVVCGQLGYPMAFGTVSDLKRLPTDGRKVEKHVKKTFNKELKTVLMKNVHCNGTENKLRNCTHYGFGSYHNPSGKVATARCGFHRHPSCDNSCKQVSSYVNH